MYNVIMNLFRTSNRARIDPTGTQAPPRILVQNPGTDIMQMAIREDPHVEEGHLERLRAQLEAHLRRNERLNRAFSEGGERSAVQVLESLAILLAAPITAPYYFNQASQETQIQRNIDREINVQDVRLLKQEAPKVKRCQI